MSDGSYLNWNHTGRSMALTFSSLSSAPCDITPASTPPLPVAHASAACYNPLLIKEHHISIINKLCDIEPAI